MVNLIEFSMKKITIGQNHIFQVEKEMKISPK